MKKGWILLGSLILSFILYAVVAHIQNKATTEDLEEISGGDQNSDGELRQLMPPPKTDSTFLELQSWSWHAGYGFVTVEGTVKNISGMNLKDVEAEVSFLAKDGSFINSTDALIDSNPILPDQSGRFKALATYNSKMEKVSIQFRSLTGETFPWKEMERTPKN